MIRTYAGTRCSASRDRNGTNILSDTLVNIYLASDIHIDETVPLSTSYGYNTHALPYLKGFIKRVNSDHPDIVLNAGDLVNGYHNGFTWFLEAWDQIQGKPSYIVPGNHDYDTYIQDNMGAQTANEYVADKLGYTHNGTVNAGSYFNQSHTHTIKGITIKLICFDVYEDDDGLYKTLSGGNITEDLQTWITSEIMGFTGDVIILLSHEGGNYIGTQEETFYSTIQGALNELDDVQLYHIYGHLHPSSSVITEYSDNITLFNSVAMISTASGQFTHLTINDSKELGYNIQKCTDIIGGDYTLLPQRGSVIHELLFNEGTGDDLTDTISGDTVTFNKVSWQPGGYGLYGTTTTTITGTGEDVKTLYLVLYFPTAKTSSSGGTAPINFGNSNDLVIGSATASLTNEILTTTQSNGGRGGWCDASASLSGWHLIELCWDGSKYVINLDGSDKTVTTYGTPILFTDSTIGIGQKGNGSGGWSGRLAYMALFSTSLSSAERKCARRLIAYNLKRSRNIKINIEE